MLAPCVNKSRREAAVPGQGIGPNGSEALVLPGAWRWGGTTQLRRTSFRGGEELPVDATWLRGAHLVVLDWTAVKRTFVRVNVTVR